MKSRPFLGAVLLALLPASEAWACTKTVRWFDDAPYLFRDANGQVAGIDADIAREALRQSGCTVKFVYMSWARALIELERGKLDILTGAFRSPERERYAHFSVPLPQSSNILYLGAAAAQKFRPTSLDALAGTSFRLGVQLGVSYGDSFERFKAMPAAVPNLVPITLRCSAWKMLALGRLDGMIADEASAAAELKQLGLLDQVHSSKVTVSTGTAMFALSRATNDADFVAHFNRALTALIADGSYRRLRERYHARGTAQKACSEQIPG